MRSLNPYIKINKLLDYSKKIKTKDNKLPKVIIIFDGNVFDEKLVDKLIYFVAPKIIGGTDALGAVGGQGIDRLKEALQIKGMTVARLGDDLVIEGNI